MLLLAVALLAAGTALIVKATGAFERLELQSVDARFDVRGKQSPPPGIVIVDLDDKTLNSTDPPTRLPINRARHAKVIEELTKAGAGVIAYDFQFTEESDDIDADNALVQAVADSPKVVLGTADVNDDGTTNIFGGQEGLDYSGATPANTSYVNNSDGRIRTMPFALEKLRNFGLVAAEMKLGHRITTPPGDEAWIDYPGPNGTFPALSFGDVENGKFDPNDVKGKIVIVGAGADAAQDQHQTSTSGNRFMSGPEIEAAATATALAGFPLKPADNWVNTLLAILVAIVAPLVALRFGTLAGLIAGLLAVIAFVIGAQLAFAGGTILAFVPPLAGAIVGLAGTALTGNPQRSPALNRLLDRVTAKKGNQRTRRLRALLLLGGAFSIIALTLILDAGHVLRNADLATVDQRFRIRGDLPVPDNVVVAAYDDKTFSQQPTFPIPRELWTKGIRKLTEAGASVIAMDVQLTEQSGDSKEAKKVDNDLIEAIHDAPSFVASTTETDGSGRTSVLSFGKGLAYSGAIPAITLVEKDADGRVRRMNFRQQELVSFPMAAAQAQAGRTIETPGGNTAWINYAGGAERVPYISYADILSGNFEPGQVRGKVVVIGGTATSLQDQHNTSTTRNALMPGPEIQANSIATALQGFPLRESSWWLNVILIIVVALAAPIAGLRLGVRPAVGIGLAVLFAFLVFAQMLFQHGDRIVTVIYPFAAGVAAIVLTAAIHGLTVAFEREQARDAFARFVPEAVVDQVLADSDGVRLGGVRGEATVMFSDLRGFTSFSESLEPERVIESLQPLPDRDERGDPRPRRHARRLHG